MNKKLVFATVVSALGSLLFGFDTAVISGTTKYITQYFSLTDTTLGITVSMALWGTVVGSIAVGKPGDLFGRRAMLFVTAAMYLVSSVGCALSRSLEALMIFRFLGGIAIGAASVMAPMYIAELSPARIRGRLVAVAQFNIVIGILIAFFSNYLLVNIGPDNWRWMFGVVAIPSALFFILLFIVPESPRWLMKMGRREQAKGVLAGVGASNVESELEEIGRSLQEEHGTTKLLQRKYAFVIMLASLLAFFTQASGINVIMYYAPMIFEKAGASTSSAMLEAVAVGITNLIFTIIAMFLIDKIGRRPLLMIGGVGMFISLASAALHYYDSSLVSDAAMVVSILGFVACFAFSQGAVVWVFLSEIFPNRIRGKGQALGSFVDWVVNAFVGLLFPLALANFGGGDVFMFFAVLMIPFFFFVLKIMPETKGKSLEELEKLVVVDN